jgi:hypothetical protein
MRIAATVSPWISTKQPHRCDEGDDVQEPDGVVGILSPCGHRLPAVRLAVSKITENDCRHRRHHETEHDDR